MSLSILEGEARQLNKKFLHTAGRETLGVLKVELTLTLPGTVNNFHKETELKDSLPPSCHSVDPECNYI